MIERMFFRLSPQGLDEHVFSNADGRWKPVFLVDEVIPDFPVEGLDTHRCVPVQTTQPRGDITLMNPKSQLGSAVRIEHVGV
jgi:hypothetical protein